MKISILFIGIILSCASLFAQSSQTTALVSGNESDLEQSLASNYISFTLPENSIESTVLSIAQQYEDLFSVVYENDSHKATLYFADTLTSTRMSTVRFLFSNQIDFVAFNGTTYSCFDFFNQYLK